MISIRSGVSDNEDYTLNWQFKDKPIYRKISTLLEKYNFPQEYTPKIVRDRQADLDEFPIADLRG